ncbi:MAG: nuclear transport factor 2 family protein [Sulfuricaulis sp.]|nr:nuclear transport factor 2 family protein [Sulfuricaulis sp.]
MKLTSPKLTSPNLKLLGSYLDAWNTHDVARVLAFFVPDSVYEDTVLAESFVGHAALRTFLEDMFRAYPDASFELHAAFDSGNCVSWEWTMHGHFTGTGKSRLPAKGQTIALRGASFTELRDGLIVCNRDYWDMGALMKQLGLKVGAPAT